MDRLMAALGSAIALARSHEATIAIAAYDGGGRCLGSLRMDGAPWLLEEEAQATALACASLGLSVASMARLRGQAWFESLLTRRTDLGVGGGGVVVKEAGAVVAAFGVAGASDEVDRLCAERAAEAFGAVSPAGPVISEQQFRRTMGAFPTGVAVVTTVERQSGQARGMTANSVVSLSCRPPIVGVVIGVRTQSYRAFVESESFAVSILDASKADVALALAKSGPEKFAGVPLGTSVSGLPVVEDGVASFECRTAGAVDIGDHVMIWGQMVWADEPAEGRDPLVFLGKGRLAMAVAPLPSDDAA
jgi:flavin reductase (DIM6/NTAB) family NADH-FMN oxidoreductase RutF/uncharacterized protein GlcG (DUF336 family)